MMNVYVISFYLDYRCVMTNTGNILMIKIRLDFVPSIVTRFGNTLATRAQAFPSPFCQLSIAYTEKLLVVFRNGMS